MEIIQFLLAIIDSKNCVDQITSIFTENSPNDGCQSRGETHMTLSIGLLAISNDFARNGYI